MAWELHHSEFSAQLYLGLALIALGPLGQITPLLCLSRKQDCARSSHERSEPDHDDQLMPDQVGRGRKTGGTKRELCSLVYKSPLW
jgi:hypothetical protein